MGILAFDIEMKSKIYACDAVKKDKGGYICPDNHCKGRNVPVYLCERSTGNCFVSYDKSLHHPDCDFISAYEAAYQNAVLANASLEEIYQVITSTKKNEKQGDNLNYSYTTESQPMAHSLTKHDIMITRLYQLYRYCASNTPQHLACGTPIQDFFISTGTAPIWYEKRKEIDNRLVLAVGYIDRRFANQRRIRIKISQSPKLMLSIVFESENEFKTIINKINAYRNKDHGEDVPVKVCVFGYAASKPYSFSKDGKVIRFTELTISAASNAIHFLSRKKSN